MFEKDTFLSFNIAHTDLLVFYIYWCNRLYIHLIFELALISTCYAFAMLMYFFIIKN